MVHNATRGIQCLPLGLDRGPQPFHPAAMMLTSDMLRCSLATSGPGLGSPLPHLHRDWACPSHVCTGTRLTRASCAGPTAVIDSSDQRRPAHSGVRLRIYFAAHGQEALQDLTMAAGITRDFEVFHQRGIVYHKIHDYAKVTPRAPLDCPEAPGVAARRLL